MDVREYLEFESTSNWMTNVSIYNSRNAYQIFFRMNLVCIITISLDSKYRITAICYYPRYDSIMGCILGCIVIHCDLYRFSAFAAYFLTYNQSQFYLENKDWEDFGMKVGVNKPRDSIDGEYHRDKPVSELSVPVVSKSEINNNTMVFEMAEL